MMSKVKTFRFTHMAFSWEWKTCRFSYSNFPILATGSSEVEVKIIEALFINKNNFLSNIQLCQYGSCYTHSIFWCFLGFFFVYIATFYGLRNSIYFCTRSGKSDSSKTFVTIIDLKNTFVLTCSFIWFHSEPTSVKHLLHTWYCRRVRPAVLCVVIIDKLLFHRDYFWKINKISQVQQVTGDCNTNMWSECKFPLWFHHTGSNFFLVEKQSK